jgi:peptidylamidoglycolate lyase
VSIKTLDYSFVILNLFLTFPDEQIGGWPKLGDRNLGSVSAVTLNNAGNVVIFHRGTHIWDGQSFNLSEHYLQQESGPIDVNTILEIDRTSGLVIKEWGKNL